MWGLGAACIRPDAVFVSGVPDGLYTRESTRDVGHKMRRYLVLGDVTGKRFSPFLIRHPQTTRLQMLLHGMLMKKIG
jgi:hypothetical protein